MSGALQWQELMQIATGIGFAPPVLVKSVIFESDNPKDLGKHYTALALYRPIVCMAGCMCML